MSFEEQIDCATCQWNKNCIEPPTMTREEIEERVKESVDEDGDKGLMKGLLATMMFVGRDTQATICPIFANKLNESAELSNKIKELMKSK